MMVFVRCELLLVGVNGCLGRGKVRIRSWRFKCRVGRLKRSNRTDPVVSTFLHPSKAPSLVFYRRIRSLEEPRTMFSLRCDGRPFIWPGLQAWCCGSLEPWVDWTPRIFFVRRMVVARREQGIPKCTMWIQEILCLHPYKWPRPNCVISHSLPPLPVLICAKSIAAPGRGCMGREMPCCMRCGIGERRPCAETEVSGGSEQLRCRNSDVSGLYEQYRCRETRKSQEATSKAGTSEREHLSSTRSMEAFFEWRRETQTEWTARRST